MPARPSLQALGGLQDSGPASESHLQGLLLLAARGSHQQLAVRRQPLRGGLDAAAPPSQATPSAADKTCQHTC